MSSHNRASFNHSCLRVPRNPLNKQPVPVFEQSYVNEIESKVRKLSLGSNEETKLRMKSVKDYDVDCFRAFIEFFDSIPNYEDVNHLSNADFYRKLERLKEKQRTYCDCMYEEKGSALMEELGKKRNTNKRSYSRKAPQKSSLKSLCANDRINSGNYNKNHKREEEDDSNISSSDKEMLLNKPPSRRSVRIESPSEKLQISSENTPEVEYFRSKSRAINNVSSASSKGKNSWDDSTVEDLKLDTQRFNNVEGYSRSAPASPNKSKQSVGWKDTITIPKPFQMTVRDEENQIIDEILMSSSSGKVKEKKPEMFRAHPVPMQSKIPLFDKIMADQERRRERVKKRSKATLMAQMRPFSFTQREEEMDNLTKRLSRSTPNLHLEDFYEPNYKSHQAQFKAKPVPKNLFSNYVYKKMHEDEFYRALQKKIRAEEMFRAASLPPSMAKRERCMLKAAICSRALNINDEPVKRTGRKVNRKRELICNERDGIGELMREYLSYVPKSFGKRTKKKRIKSSSSTTSRTNTDTNRGGSSLSFDCLTRSNLAAVLRAQNAKKRLAKEMYSKLEEAKFMEEARWKEKMMRKKPVWGVLSFSHEEDLAMRLQMRRDEERLRNEEHRQLMHSIFGRVNRQPTLFERQSQGRNESSDKGLMMKYYKDAERYSEDSPKYSFSDCSDKRYLMDVKDEATQAGFDLENNLDNVEYALRDK